VGLFRGLVQIWSSSGQHEISGRELKQGGEARDARGGLGGGQVRGGARGGSRFGFPRSGDWRGAGEDGREGRGKKKDFERAGRVLAGGWRGREPRLTSGDAGGMNCSELSLLNWWLE